MIPPEELLKMASAFDLGPEPLLGGRPYWWLYFKDDVRLRSVEARNMGHPDGGTDRWGIFVRNDCLCKSGKWMYQRLPSSRTDHFFKQCRYDSLEEAIIYYRKWKEVVERYAVKKLGVDPAALAAGKIPFEEYKSLPIFNYDEIPASKIRYTQLMKVG